MGLSERLTSGNDIFCNVMYLSFGTHLFLGRNLSTSKKKKNKTKDKNNPT